MVQAQAIFNYFGVKYDRSYGVHNPKYVKAIYKIRLKHYRFIKILKIKKKTSVTEVFFLILLMYSANQS